MLSALPVIDTNEGIVGGGEADAFCCQSTRQPAVTVAVELQAERRPCRHPQIGQAKLGIDEIEIVVETLAAVRPHEGLVRLLVVPRLVSAARLHRRDDMHQAGCSPRRFSTSATTASFRMWLLAMCSIVIPACAASDAARSRTRSRSVEANCG